MNLPPPRPNGQQLPPRVVQGVGMGCALLILVALGVLGVSFVVWLVLVLF
jgi:hypothetical protein